LPPGVIAKGASSLGEVGLEAHWQPTCLGPTPHPLQQRFAELGASQCGYCSSGFLLTAKSLLEQQPDPDRETLKQELAGNLCRCTGYLQIFQAIEKAAADLREGATR